MTKYQVTGNVSQIGKRKHIFKAVDRDAAKARFRRAYSKHECTEIVVGKV